METLQIKKVNAFRAFNKANKETKEVLTELFGKEVTEQKITDLIKSYEDASEIYPPSEHLKTLINYSGHDKDMRSTRAFAKLTIISRALNEGWEPNWDNGSEYKYYPWFTMSASGFSYLDCDRWFSYSLAPGRLCFKSSELAEYAGRQFTDLYKEFMLIN